MVKRYRYIPVLLTDKTIYLLSFAILAVVPAILQETFFVGIIAILFAAILGLYLLGSLKDPYLMVVWIPIGSYLGYFIVLFQNAVIPFSLFQIFLVLSFIVFGLNFFLSRNFHLRLTGHEMEWSLFFLFILFSLIYSPNRSEGLLYALRLFFLIGMVYLLLNTIRTKQQLTFILGVVVFISVILSIVSIKEGLLNKEAAVLGFLTSGQKIISRATGVQKDPNIFATHFFLPILLTASITLNRKIHWSKRIIGAILFIILFLGIISTYSRSGWIAISLSLLMMAIWFRQKKVIVALFLLGVLILLLFPNYQFILFNLIKRFFGVFTGEIDESSRVRIYLGIGAVKMFFDSYLWGVGFRGFPVVFPKIIPPQNTLGVVEPHNIFYTILAELGIVGFLIFLWIIGKILSTGIGVLKHPHVREDEYTMGSALVITFVAYLIFYQFYGGGLFDNNFWIIISLIFCLQRLRWNPQ